MTVILDNQLQNEYNYQNFRLPKTLHPDRTLFHADSSYYYPNVHLVTRPLKTHTCSNTAYRGFGGPQGMLAGERFIEEMDRYTRVLVIDWNQFLEIDEVVDRISEKASEKREFLRGLTKR